jgi:hypothetical protein
MIEKNKIELESILNKETLSQPPFLIVNLPENLIPLRLCSQRLKSPSSTSVGRRYLQYLV